MKPILLAGAAVLLLTATAAARADDTLGFLQRKNMTTPQSTPLPMPVTSPAEQQRNKQVVLDFYKVISDHRAWTAANRDKYFAPDFRQHDPAEPDTSKAFFDYFNQMMPPAAGGKPRPRMMMVGTTANDSNGSPVNWMVAEGNAVVVIRHRNWPWPNGPQPVYNGIFVDVWLLKDGKITDQWCSCTPADANLPHIFAAMKAGDFPKTPE